VLPNNHVHASRSFQLVSAVASLLQNWPHMEHYKRKVTVHKQFGPSADATSQFNCRPSYRL